MTKWKKLDKKSLGVLQAHYLCYEPYAHLNVVDLWGYRTGPAYWSNVGDTIIYRLHDYVDDQEYFTLLGKDSAKKAVVRLCKELKDLKTLVLDSVPEITYETLKGWPALIDAKEDVDNHDYIFKVDTLINFSSEGLRHKHPKYLKLIRKHPDIKIRVLDHTKATDRALVYRLFKHWVKQNDSGKEWEKELLALKRTLNLKIVDLVCLGVFDKKRLIGFTVNEPESSGYYQGHFGKADYAYSNMGILLEHETAKYMKEHYGSQFLNLQQDLGIEGMRYYKSSLGPTKHLKKFIVTIDVQKALKT